MKTPNQIMRDQTAKAKKQIHGSLLKVEPLDNTPSDLNLLPNAIWVIGGILACGIIFFSCQPAHAYTEGQAIKVIVGESANQGLLGMIAVGEVLRTQKSLKGFYGYKAMNHRKEPKWVWDMARQAWKASKTSHITNGATHFENIHAFGCPYWVKSCVKTFAYKDHVFYKEII